MQEELAALAKKVMGQVGWEEDSKRREVTLYSFRRFVKTTLSDLGLEQFSEYWIGHEHSVYWSESAQKIAEMWQKVEPFLTFLDPGQQEAREAEAASWREAMEE
jgi:hypothetical protein